MTQTPWIRTLGRRAEWKASFVALRLSVGLTLGSVAFASTVAAQAPPNQRGTSQSSNAKPEEAAPATIAAFETYEVVGVGAAHGEKDLDDFLLSLIRHPAFPTAVDDIVVECGNSRYQAILDRYIAGDTVALSEVRPVWRNTTQNMCSTSAFYEEFFPLVREVNRRLPSTKRLRVVAGDSPIDWHAVNGPADGAAVMRLMLDRDSNVAAVMEREVFAKHRKALMLYGEQHLFHGVRDNAIGRYEAHHPGTTLVIYTHASLGCDVPSAKLNDAIEARVATGPIPSLTHIKGTWLAEVPTPSPPFPRSSGALYDAFLYLGPRHLLLAEAVPALVFVDKDFMSELARRTQIGVGSNPGMVDPEYVRTRATNHLLCPSS